MLGTCLEAALLYSLEDSGGTLGAEGECSTVRGERRNSLKGFCRTQITKHIFELLLRYYPLRLKGQYSEMVELQLVLLLRQLLFWYTSARILVKKMSTQKHSELNDEHSIINVTCRLDGTLSCAF